MKNVRRGILVLALSFAVGTVGACAGNRTQPDWRPRASRGSDSAPGRNKTRVKRDDRRGNRDGDNGRHRGHGKKKGDHGNGNGKKRGNP